jgi:hypothetical protein
VAIPRAPFGWPIREWHENLLNFQSSSLPLGFFIVGLYRFPWRTQIKTTGLFFPFLARLFLMDVRYPFQRELDSVYK